MSFIDKAIIKTALATQPHLRHNLRSVFQSLGGGPLDESRLAAIEVELVDTLRVTEALAMPTDLPEQGRPLELSGHQHAILSGVVARFRDPSLRDLLQRELSGAVGAGRIQVRG